LAVVSVLFFMLAGIFGLVGSWFWKRLIDDSSVIWPIVVAFVTVALLPYLVVTAGCD